MVSVHAILASTGKGILPVMRIDILFCLDLIKEKDNKIKIGKTINKLFM